MPRYVSPSGLLPVATILILTGVLLMIAAHVTAPVSEDDPDWNCNAHGNHICADPASETTAWRVFDDNNGMLDAVAEVIDVNRPLRVEYVGVALLRPTLSEGDVAVCSEGTWYVFHAENLD